MAKKFVKVTGLNKVFSDISATGATTWSYAGTLADLNSILYITADATDTTTFGNPYREGTHWIWAKGQLFDGNEVDSTYLASITRDSSTTAIALTDDLELIINKLMYQIADAKKSGVQSLTTSDDAWIVIDPDLNASTGAVTLNVSHGLAGTAVAVASDASTVSGWGSTASITVLDASFDARGHVISSTAKEKTLTVTLPSAPVTGITSAGDSVVNVTANTAATGAVTLDVSHAKKGANVGSFGSVTSNTSFKVASVTVDEYGHTTAASETEVALGSAALKADDYWSVSTHDHDSDYAAIDHKHAVTLSGDVTCAANSSIDGTITTTLSDGVVTKAKLADSIFGSVTADDASLVTGGQVWTAIEEKVAGAVDYLGGVTSQTDVTTKKAAGYGDFVRATGNFNFNDASVHAGDMIILDSSAKDAYATASNWVIVHGENDSWREIKANGTTVYAANNPQALDLSSGLYVNVKTDATNNKIYFDASIVSLEDGSNGAKGLAEASDVAKVINDNEKVISETFGAIQGSVGLGTDMAVDWDDKFADGTTIVNAIKDLSTDLAAIDVPEVSYTQTVTSSTEGAVKLGTINVGTSTYDVYGKDTVYVHPAAPTTGSAVNTSTGEATTTVVSGVIADASGHIAKVVTTTVVDTDEKVKAEASEAKIYLLGQATTGAATTASFDEDVYTEAGALHATSLYEGSWSVHDSSVGDWAEI